jgi:hypothetical protein
LKIRRVDLNTDIITSFAGNGGQDDPLGNGGLATVATLMYPTGVYADGARGVVYTAENANTSRVRVVDLTTNIINA